MTDYIPEYRPVQREVRNIQTLIRKTQADVLQREDDIKRTTDTAKISKLEAKIASLKAREIELQESIPTAWESASNEFKLRNESMIKARRAYQNNVDTAYAQLAEVQDIVNATDDAIALQDSLDSLLEPIQSGDLADAMSQIKAVEGEMSAVLGVSKIKTLLSKSRRALKKGEDQREKANSLYHEAMVLYQQNIEWRQQAKASFQPLLSDFMASLSETVGLRSQNRLTIPQAKFIARCQADHQDISVYF